MSHSQIIDTEHHLTDVPAGSFRIVREGVLPLLAPTLSAGFPDSRSGKGLLHIYPLYPGIELVFMKLEAESAFFRHEALDHVLEINFCRDGRVGWDMGEQGSLYLGPGDFALHTMALCANSVMQVPLGYCEGITIRVDLNILSSCVPELMEEMGVSAELLRHQFCTKRSITTFSGGEKHATVFSSFFDVPEELRPGYYKLKVQELLLYLCRIPCHSCRELNQYPPEQIQVIREIHNYLMGNLDRRISIEELSRMFLMNTTTLKAIFKAVYGASVAAHIKEHRMERAAYLLRETKDSVAEIARSVGYESQSKFTAAFKDVYGTLPTAYRKCISPEL